ncbi:MAG: CapA family protein, partial [Ruminococcaceae bacterium]|nr:CapA family protein [Oscillospiraceae bacterium]
MKFTAVGDLLMQRRMPGEYDGFAEVRDYIAKGDFRFANLETTLNHIGAWYGSQYSGGTWLRAEPEILEDVAAYGFNVLSFNNNHSMDYSYD